MAQLERIKNSILQCNLTQLSLSMLSVPKKKSKKYFHENNIFCRFSFIPLEIIDKKSLVTIYK